MGTMDTIPAQETVDIIGLHSDETERQLIQNIIDSYHHDWDVLAELCQNAIDAIREKDPPKGTVEIRFDRKGHSIQVLDTGVGMTRDKVSRALAPNVTFKKGQAKLIGEKGLGLTFCVFRTNKITLETSRGDGLVHTISFERGRDWLEERTAKRPFVVVSTRSEPSGSFTKVSADDVSADWDLEWLRLQHLLVTKTALGSTFPLFWNYKAGIRKSKSD